MSNHDIERILNLDERPDAMNTSKADRDGAADILFGIFLTIIACIALSGVLRYLADLAQFLE